jgi:ribose/xylose/arabinose/galactoside ABC-type transport system permease subunit
LLCALLGSILVVLTVFAPNFSKPQNGVNIIVQASTLGILATGMAFVMIGGGIDLSMPANMALAAVVGALYMSTGGGGFVGSLLMIAVGLLNGLAVAYLGMIPFVVTLAMLTVVTGVTIWVPSAVKAMEGGCLDDAALWDTYGHARELDRVLIAIAKSQGPGCGDKGCLVNGRIGTPATIGTMDNIWSKKYTDQ